MTTPAPDDWWLRRDFGDRLLEVLLRTEVLDAARLQILDRALVAERTILEARVNQLDQVHEMLQERMRQAG